MDTNGARLTTALRTLVDDGVITVEQAASMARVVTGGRRHRHWLVETAGYVGGTLMLAGVATFVGLAWDEYSPTAWSVLGILVSAVLAGVGLLVAGGSELGRARGDLGRGARGDLARGSRGEQSGARRRVGGVLLGLAAIGVTISVWIRYDDPEYLAPAIGTAVAVAGYALLRTVPGALVAGMLSLIAASVAAEDLDGVTGVLPLGGLVILALGVLWTGLGLAGVVVPRPLAGGIGATIGLIGAQHPLNRGDWEGWAYGLTAAFAVACLLLYRRVGDTVLLVAGVVATSIVVPEAVWDATDGAGGAAVILVVTGAVLLAASGLGLALRTHTTRPHTTQPDTTHRLPPGGAAAAAGPQP